MPYKDKNKIKEAKKNYYLRNKEKVKQRTYEIRERTRAWLFEYKSKLKCLKCSEDHISTLDFHHKGDEEKNSTISRMVHNGYKIESILKEIDKCVVLCANCHRKLHYEENL